MKVGIVPHLGRSDALVVARKLVAELRGRGLTPVAETVAAGQLDVPAHDPVADELDALVAVGGDGTVLRAVQVALAADVPVLGVNLGRIGFLADADASALDEVAALLAGGDWVESERMTIRAVTGDGRSAVGVNDVVVEKVESQRLVAMTVSFDGEAFLTYRADGLVFATPTGSTAYNFSANGPLVDPAVDAIILTAVAPHTLFTRSLVMSAGVQIRCLVVHDRPVGVTVDGMDLGQMSPGDHIDIARGPSRARFIQMTSGPFPSIV